MRYARSDCLSMHASPCSKTTHPSPTTSGCILGELLAGKPIFPGSSTMNQLDRILEVTGRPSQEDIDAIQSPFAATMLDSLPMVEPRKLEDMFPGAPPEALDLLFRCMQFNPDKRITAHEALRHPYVAPFHNPEDEPACTRLITICIDDNTKYSIGEYRDKLYADIVRKRKEQRKREKADGTDRARRRHRSTGGVLAGAGAPESYTKPDAAYAGYP